MGSAATIVFDLRNTRAILNYVLCTLLEMFMCELGFALQKPMKMLEVVSPVVNTLTR
jgi:hypothetical protein